MSLLKPYNNESVYSLIARHHLLSGFQSTWCSTQRLTGARGYRVLSGLPTRLKIIVSNGRLVVSPESLLHGHTDYSLYAHFISRRRRRQLKLEMLGDGEPKARLGLLRAHVGANDMRRHCTECARQDILKTGIAYWHRGVGLPGLVICPLHRRPLVCSTPASPFVRDYDLPCLSRVEPIMARSQEGMLSAIAIDLVTLMRRPAGTPINGFTYSEIYKGLGLVSGRKNVRQKLIDAAVRAWLSPLKAVAPFDRLWAALVPERNWVAKLADRRRAFHHPLKHVVLWQALNIESQDVFATANGKKRQYDLDLTVTDHDGDDLERCVVRHLKKDSSLTAVADRANCSVTTVSTIASAYGIDFASRTKSLYPETRRAIVMFCRNGNSTAVAASKFGVSVSSVNRIRRIDRGGGNYA